MTKWNLHKSHTDYIYQMHSIMSTVYPHQSENRHSTQHPYQEGLTQSLISNVRKKNEEKRRNKKETLKVYLVPSTGLHITYRSLGIDLISCLEFYRFKVERKMRFIVKQPWIWVSLPWCIKISTFTILLYQHGNYFMEKTAHYFRSKIASVKLKKTDLMIRKIIIKL